MICQLAGRHPKRISEYTLFGLRGTKRKGYTIARMDEEDEHEAD